MGVRRQQLVRARVVPAALQPGRDHGWGIDGAKLRTLFAVPNAASRRFVYGANFEFSYNAKRWDTKPFTSEVRRIIGWHLKLDVEAGIGFGLTGATDGLTLKLILSHDFNKPRPNSAH